MPSQAPPADPAASLRIRRHAVVFAVASVGLFAILVLLIWAMLGFEIPVMSVHGWIALILGTALSVGLAVGLMGAMFASDDSGIDAAVAGRVPDSPADDREGGNEPRQGR